MSGASLSGLSLSDRLFAISANSKLSGGAETAAPATVLEDSGTPAHPREPANVESYTDPG
jgi:hypothetical protein